jgi:hypothetical protein
MRHRRRRAIAQQAFEHRIERRANRITLRVVRVLLLRSIGRQRVDVAGMTRSRQRDVEQAETLILPFLCVAPLRLAVERDHALAAGMIVQYRDLAGATAVRPHQRQHDDIEFEALARVQRHQRDARRIGFDAQLFFVRRFTTVAAAFALVVEPREQQIPTRQCVTLRLQQLAKMTQVGERTLAIGTREQARARMLDHAAHGGKHATAAPQRIEFAQQRRLALPRVRIGGKRAQFVPATAAETRSERGARSAVVARMQRRVQHDLQLARPVGLEHVVAARRHARRACSSARSAAMSVWLCSSTAMSPGCSARAPMRWPPESHSTIWFAQASSAASLRSRCDSGASAR